MARTVRIERAEFARIGEIGRLESDRTDQTADSRKEQFRITHAVLDFEGRNAEISEICGVTEIAEYEDCAKSHEDHAHLIVRMGFESVEDRNTRRRRQARESPSAPRLIARKNQWKVFEEREERANLKSLRARQRAEMAIHIVGKMRIDPGHRQARPARKQNLGRRFHECGLAAMENAQSARGRSVSGHEASIGEENERSKEECSQHASRIPETVHNALADDSGSINPCTQA